MSGRFLAALRLVMLVQLRGYFPHAFAFFVATAAGVLHFLVSASVAQLILPVFLVSEPGMLGLMAVAAHRYLDIERGAGAALRVSPLRTGEWLLALVVASSLLATVAGVLTYFVVYGVALQALTLSIGLFGFALSSGLLGFLHSQRHDDFPSFVVGMIPVVLVWQLPLLAVFELVPTAWLFWLPSAPGIFAIARACDPAAEMEALGWASASLAVAALAFVAVLRSTERRLAAGALQP